MIYRPAGGMGVNTLLVNAGRRVELLTLLQTGKAQPAPLVLLDVDGVLNLGLFMSSRQRGRLRGSEGWYSGRAGDTTTPPPAVTAVMR